MAAGSLAWGDFDNDGDRDLAVAGPGFAVVYRHEGGGVFLEAVGLADEDGTAVASGTSVAWADKDNDGDLDLVITGAGESILFRNQSGSAAAAPPQAPTGLTATPGSGRVTLRWNAPATSPTPPAGLTYNLRLGRRPGAVDVVSPMAASDGRRLVAAPGNVPSGTSAVLRGLPPGTYYWSVQAVDAALAFSPFATESSFAWCGHAISPASASLGGAGGTGSVAVTAGAGCTWTAASNAAWITLTSGAGGTGNGAVGYSVAANAGAARDGT